MRKLSRKRNQRRALLRLLAENLFFREKIITTLAKAKELSSFAENLIERAKRENLASKKYLAKFFKKELVKKISEIASKYKERKGGYIRITKIGQRRSNGARMAVVELVK